MNECFIESNLYSIIQSTSYNHTNCTKFNNINVSVAQCWKLITQIKPAKISLFCIKYKQIYLKNVKIEVVQMKLIHWDISIWRTFEQPVLNFALKFYIILFYEFN